MSPRDQSFQAYQSLASVLRSTRKHAEMGHACKEPGQSIRTSEGLGSFQSSAYTLDEAGKQLQAHMLAWGPSYCDMSSTARATELGPSCICAEDCRMSVTASSWAGGTAAKVWVTIRPTGNTPSTQISRPAQQHGGTLVRTGQHQHLSCCTHAALRNWLQCCDALLPEHQEGADHVADTSVYQFVRRTCCWGGMCSSRRGGR